MGSTGDKIKGKAMQVEGKVTGDKVRMGQGALKEAKGKVEAGVDRVVRKVKRAARALKRG